MLIPILCLNKLVTLLKQTGWELKPDNKRDKNEEIWIHVDGIGN